MAEQIKKPAPQGGEVQEEGNELAKARAFLKDYGQVTIIAVGVAVALVLGVGAYRNYRKSAEFRASQMLMAARTPEQLQQIITQYGSSPSAPLAMLTMGARQFDAGQYDMARFTYSQFEQKYPQHPLLPMAKLGIAQSYEGEGQIEEAMKAFVAFSESYPGDFLAPMAVFGNARCLTQLGRFADAKVVYEDFIAKNPDSSWTALAESALLFVDKDIRMVQSGKSVTTENAIPVIQASPALASPEFPAELSPADPAETEPGR